MKMQNKEIVDFLNTCVSMKKKSLPVRLAYAIKKNVAAVQEAASAYTAEREELIRRYAKKDENGEIMTEDDCYIMFGKESAGIPEEILVNHKEDCVRIPMVGDIRSLNLGNSVAIILYEALRQQNFAHMNLEGHLHELSWEQQ